jgi:hypothetical protein
VSFFYRTGLSDAIEKTCPYFYSQADQRAPCRRNACHAFEIKIDHIEPELGVMKKYRISFCHALNKELDVEEIPMET